MEKITKKYLATLGATVLVGGMAIIATSAFADSSPTTVLTVPSVAPVVVTSSASPTDLAEAGDTPDATVGTTASDTPEAGDTPDASN